MSNNELAEGALLSIQRLLDDGGIPRGTFADEQVQNLVALYNQRGAALIEARDALIRALCEPDFYYDQSKTKAVQLVRKALSTINEVLK
jgi:hypothetical protein